MCVLFLRLLLSPELAPRSQVDANAIVDANAADGALPVVPPDPIEARAADGGVPARLERPLPLLVEAHAARQAVVAAVTVHLHGRKPLPKGGGHRVRPRRRRGRREERR